MISQSKSEQRQSLLQTKKNLLRFSDNKGYSDVLLKLFCNLPEYQTMQKVISFTPLPDEPDISLINNALNERGKEVLLILASASAPMPKNLRDFDTVIIPMQGFDRTGNRMGRGGGWYDRFLSSVLKEKANVLKIGVCFSLLEVPKIITDENDVKTDIIITEKEVIRVAG